MPRIHLVEPIPRLAAVLDGRAGVGERFRGDIGRLSSIAGDSTTVQARRAVETSGGSVVVIPIDVADEWYDARAATDTRGSAAARPSWPRTPGC